MNTEQLEMLLGGREVSGLDFPDVSPYLQLPLRTLSEAKHDHDSALLDLTTTDSRTKRTA